MSFLLSEGGVAGHMNHLYDNPDLTFKQMKDIFLAASSGELEGTEKTDGQNLQLSYDVKTGTARAARNKGNIKAGGLDAAGLADKFGGRGALETAFNEAFAAFEEAVGKMSPEEQEEIFGPDTNIYYNAEVQDPRAANVINYDVPTLTIHRVGHNEYDRETGAATGRDVSANAMKLAAVLDKVQGDREEGKFRVEMNAIRRLEALSDDTAVNLALARLEKVISDEGISDNQTVGEYVVSRVDRMIDNVINLSSNAKKQLMKRIFNVKGSNIRTVLKLVDEEDQEVIRDLVAKSGVLKFDAVAPIEEIVHDFAVEMLKGLHSAFVLDNEAEVERLRGETERAITAIENSESEEAMEILAKQMNKLKSAEGVTTAAEGFVFDYDGVTYKFTGNFAPMNQLLGLFKYGRGNVPPLEKLDEQEEDETKPRRKVAVVPGAFKPPHRGHLEMIEHYADLADEVVIMVSPLPRKTPSGVGIGFEVSKAIWDVYLRDAGLSDRVKVIKSPVNSPVSATYQFVANENDNPDMAQPGDLIIPGCSTKGGDQARFKAGFEKYAREGVSIADPISCAFIASGEALSARDFRAALDNAMGGLEQFVPPKTDPKDILSILNVGPAGINEVIMQLVRESLDEAAGMAGGAVAGYSGKVEEEEVLEEEEDEVIEEVLNYLLGKGVLS